VRPSLSRSCLALQELWLNDNELPSALLITRLSPLHKLSRLMLYRNPLCRGGDGESLRYAAASWLFLCVARYVCH
jgi:hypothetical protein